LSRNRNQSSSKHEVQAGHELLKCSIKYRQRELTDGAENSQHENEHGTGGLVRTGEIKIGPAGSKNDA
jgi:hypothetical protein